VSRRAHDADRSEDIAPDQSKAERGKGGALRWDAIAPFAGAGFRAVSDFSREALLVVDAPGVIQKANPRAWEVLKRRETSLSRTSLDRFMTNVGREARPNRARRAFHFSECADSLADWLTREGYVAGHPSGFGTHVALRRRFAGSRTRRGGTSRSGRIGGGRAL